MAGYKSRFGTLLKVKKYQQEAIHLELAEQEAQLALEKAQLEQCIKTSETAMDHISEYQRSVVGPEKIQEYYVFIKHQNGKIKEQQKKIEGLTESLEIKRTELQEAVQEKKIVETIEKRQKEAYFATIRKKENVFLDEVAGRLKTRSH